MEILLVHIDAGITSFESPSAEYRSPSLSLDSVLIPNTDSTFIGLASGHSMTELGILDGNYLIVDRSVDIQDGDIVVANLNGCFVCKILDIKNRRLVSASPHHISVPIKDEDEFQVEGVVTSTFRVFNGSERVKSCLL